MKKFLFFVLALTLFAACNNGSTVEKAEVGEAETAAPLVGGSYSVDIAASTINWRGAKVIAGAHTGTLSLSEGIFAVNNGTITGGSFTIDMKSIVVTDDLSDEKKAMLVGHLSTGDFFETETYPTATFTITGVETLKGDSSYTHSVSGNLKMKDIENNVTFKANIIDDNGTIKATSQDFAINRMSWKVEYDNSTMDIAKDKVIKDDIELQINLVANAAEEGSEATSDEGDGKEMTEEK